MFDNVAECIEYILECQSEKIFFILAESWYITVVPVIHDLEQIHSIYVLSYNQHVYCQEQQYSKVCGVYNTIDDIHEVLVQEVAVLTTAKDLAISFMPSTSGNSISLSNRLEASFMYFQLLIDVLLSINVGNAKYDMINECRRQYDGNDYQLNIIDEFERQYTNGRAIEWYTRDSFLYRILNKALRVQDIDILFKLRFFIKDLQAQLEKLYEDDEKKRNGIIVVYRSILLDFLSTTTDRNIALIYSGGGLQRPSQESVLFEIMVDQEKCQRPFHNIRDLSSFYAENEVLFAMGMICRIQSIQEVDGVWSVKLTSNEEDDEDLKKLRLHMREELTNETNIVPFGKLLSMMGEYDKLVQFYLLMLAEMSDDDPKRQIFHSHLGATYTDLGKYEEALPM
ncbi:unnamed protein product [Rotaria sp. Silwood2]|nr:unnamed protein product [Rotaria sp. Silwood2]CAF4095577.1 unnamed protein product [Rotaria sp. Silwood2]